MHIRIAYIHTYIHTNLYSAKNRENESEHTGPVSYTHLTLPTTPYV